MWLRWVGREGDIKFQERTRQALYSKERRHSGGSCFGAKSLGVDTVGTSVKKPRANTFAPDFLARLRLQPNPFWQH